MDGPKKTRVLHILGSPASDYYEQLSTMYAQGCVASNAAPCADEFEYIFAVVHADGPSWSFPSSLEPSVMAAAERYPLANGISKLSALNADVAQSHMFCVQGVSTFRALLDMLNVPFLGGDVAAMTLTNHKGRSKAVVKEAGVPVPAGEVLLKTDYDAGAKPTLAFPFIVKPCSEDNSMGVSIVREASELASALDEAFKFDDEVLCEQFIPPGREIRFAILEDEEGEPTIVLPGVEYFMSQEAPIRTSNDKLTSDKSGKLSFAAPSRQCPADIDDELRAQLTDAAKRAHVALGCRDYSLYDFRVSPEGKPYFLEASLFCCFAPNSVISMMGDKSGSVELQHQELFKTLLRRAAARKPEAREAGVIQAFGSGAKKQKVKKQSLSNEMTGEPATQLSTAA
jgi:D-alanine-D-alanine ligase